MTAANSYCTIMSCKLQILCMHSIINRCTVSAAVWYAINLAPHFTPHTHTTQELHSLHTQVSCYFLLIAFCHPLTQSPLPISPPFTLSPTSPPIPHHHLTSPLHIITIPTPPHTITPHIHTITPHIHTIITSHHPLIPSPHTSSPPHHHITPPPTLPMYTILHILLYKNSYKNIQF